MARLTIALLVRGVAVLAGALTSACPPAEPESPPALQVNSRGVMARLSAMAPEASADDQAGGGQTADGGATDDLPTDEMECVEAQDDALGTCQRLDQKPPANLGGAGGASPACSQAAPASSSLDGPPDGP